MGQGQIFLSQVGPGLPHLGLENFPKNPKFFLSDQKNLIGPGQKIPASKMGRSLFYSESKACSGLVRANLYYLEMQF